MSSEADSESGSRGPNVRFIIESALMIALITGAAILLETVLLRKPIDRLEKIFDDISVAYFTLRVDQPHPKVAVVAIDDPTIDELPWRSPVSRTFLANLLEILDKGGPAGIGIDVTFFEPSYDPSDDERLARVLSNMKTPVVLATGLKGDARRPLAEIFEKIENPLVKTALANFPVDREDRTLRDFRPAFEDKNGDLHDTMAVELARQAGAEAPRTTEDIPIAWYGQPGVQDRELPGGGFAGERPIAIFSALNLLKVPAIAMILKDKVVLVGATFEGSHDFLRTPFDLRTVKDESFAGVFGHAQVVAQLLDGRPLEHDRGHTDRLVRTARGPGPGVAGRRICRRAAHCHLFGVEPVEGACDRDDIEGQGGVGWRDVRGQPRLSAHAVRPSNCEGRVLRGCFRPCSSGRPVARRALAPEGRAGRRVTAGVDGRDRRHVGRTIARSGGHSVDSRSGVTDRVDSRRVSCSPRGGHRLAIRASGPCGGPVARDLCAVSRAPLRRDR